MYHVILEYATNPFGPWNAGSGSEELNGTYDMMGNVWEWMENPHYPGEYIANSLANRVNRGSSYNYGAGDLRSSARTAYVAPYMESLCTGFRSPPFPNQPPCPCWLSADSHCSANENNHYNQIIHRPR